MLGVDLRDRELIRFVVEEFESEFLPDFNCFGAKNFTGNVKTMRLESLCNPGGYVMIPWSDDRFDFVFVKNMIQPLLL